MYVKLSFISIQPDEHSHQMFQVEAGGCKHDTSSFPAAWLKFAWFVTSCVLLQMSEMEISRAVAERSLREHMGNVVEALVTLTNWAPFKQRTAFSNNIQTTILDWTLKINSF